MITDIVLGAFRLVFDGLFTLTGEIVLWVISLGRRKPRWDLYVTERPMRFYLLNDASMYIGIVFWLVLAVAVHRLFFATPAPGIQ